MWVCGNCKHQVPITDDLKGFNFRKYSNRISKLGCPACGSYTIQQAYDDSYTAGIFLIVRSKLKVCGGKGK